MRRLFFLLIVSVLFVRTAQSVSLTRFAEEEKPFSHKIFFEFNGDPGHLRDYPSENGVTVFASVERSETSLKGSASLTIDTGRIDVRAGRKAYGYKILKKGRLLNIIIYYTPMLGRAPETDLRFLALKEKPAVKEDVPDETDGGTEVGPEADVPVASDPAEHRQKKEKWVVVIDPGHGGHSSGAVGPSGYKEKDLVLDVSRQVRDKLRDDRRIEVVMTRDRDEFVSLSGRAGIANRLKADLFISIHANAVWGKKRRELVRGVETYFLGEALTDEDRALAIKENEDIKYDSEYADTAVLEMILSDMTQNRYLKESSDLAFYVQKNLIAATGWTDRGVKQNSYYVLRFCYMPSILIEIGFISQPQEEKLLKSQKYKDLIARRIAESIREYVRKHDETYAE